MFMSQLPHIRRAVGWFLVALLATSVLANVVGFFSPFWGHLRAPGDPAASRGLLQAWQPVAALLSVLYLLPAWHVSRTLGSPWTRALVLGLAALVVVAKVGVAMATRSMDAAGATGSIEHLAVSMAVAVPFVVFLVFVYLVWRALRDSAELQPRQDHV